MLDGLATGVYRVQADATDGGYARQYYSSTSDWDLAAQVSVTAGTSTYDIDFALQSGGAISGTARRSSDDTPIVGAEVWAETYVCCRGGNGARTDENGEYDITGLAPADYRVRLDASHLGLATQFFSSTDQWALADRVAVSSGTTTPDIDFRVAQGGSISGVVTGSGGIAGVNVWAEPFVCCRGGHGAFTGPYGSYTIDGLAAGQYRVGVDAAFKGCSRQYYSSTNDWDLALPVAVISGQDTGGISFTLALGGSIAGVVRDTSGNAISNADVWANSYVCCGGGNGARSDGQGEYLIQGLPAGEYRVTSDASRQGYSRQFYTGTAAWTWPYR